MRQFYHFRMRQFYHFRREKRSVHSPNPLRAPAQSTAFSNRRFNRRAAQNRSSSDSAQPHLQNHAASAAKLSMYKASCAGFTTLLRFGIKPAPAQLPLIRANALQKPSPHKVVHHSIPRNPICKTTLPVPLSYPCTKHLASDSPRSFASASNPAPRSTLTHPRERPSKNIAAQSRSPFDSVQPHLQNHAASASQLSMYKVSCAGFTTLLRFSIKPCAPLIRAKPFKNHRRTKTLSIRFHASPPAKPRCQCLPVIHVQSILRRIHHAPSIGINPALCPTPAHPRERPSKTIAAQNRSPSDSTQAQRCSSIPRKSPSAGFTAFLCFGIKPAPAQLLRIRANVFQKPSPHKTALHPIPRKPSDAQPSRTPSAGFTAFLCIASNPTKPIQRPTIRTCSAARAGDYGQPERRRTKKPPHPIGCGG